MVPAPSPPPTPPLTSPPLSPLPPPPSSSPLLPANTDSPLPPPPVTSPPLSSPLGTPPPLPPSPVSSEDRPVSISPKHRLSPTQIEDFESIEEDLYWSCSDCSCSGSFHTCEDAEDLASLFACGGSQAMLDDDSLDLEDVLRARAKARSMVRSRSLSPCRSRLRPRSRGRSKSLSRSSERKRRKSRSSSAESLKRDPDSARDDFDFGGGGYGLDGIETFVSTPDGGKRKGPQIHPNGEARRKRSRSRSTSLTKEIVASFLDFRGKVLERPYSESQPEGIDQQLEYIRKAEKEMQLNSRQMVPMTPSPTRGEFDSTRETLPRELYENALKFNSLACSKRFEESEESQTDESLISLQDIRSKSAASVPARLEHDEEELSSEPHYLCPEESELDKNLLYIPKEEDSHDRAFLHVLREDDVKSSVHVKEEDFLSKNEEFRAISGIKSVDRFLADSKPDSQEQIQEVFDQSTNGKVFDRSQTGKPRDLFQDEFVGTFESDQATTIRSDQSAEDEESQSGAISESVSGDKDSIIIPVLIFGKEEKRLEEAEASPWKEISSEKVTTRVILHSDSKGNQRTLTLEHIKTHKQPEAGRFAEQKEGEMAEKESQTEKQPLENTSFEESIEAGAVLQQREFEETESVVHHLFEEGADVVPLGTEDVATAKPGIVSLEDGDYGKKLLDLMKKSGDWLELRVVELSPGLVYLGSTLEEATTLQKAHHDVLTKLQSKQSPVEDLLNQADQLISTQRPRAEVYAAMAESLGLAWRDLNTHLETRKNLLDLSVTFHTRARQYSNALDAAEKTYTNNVMPSDVESARALITALHDHKRAILEASMFTLQEAQVLLGRLKGLLHEGGSLDSRPQHIRTNIEFACSQIEHYLESLHDRRRFLDGLFIARKHHLEQCLTLCILYQDLTEAILNLKKLRDEISEHQDLGESQANAEILLHEHLRRENAAKAQQDQCVRHVKTTEQMVASGHYAGAEARARAYSVLEAATALHETCDTRTALLQQSALFFRLANGALTKLDQAEVQVAALSSGGGGNQRLSVVMGVVEEAVQPALAEGYALLEVTGGRGQPHNKGITEMVEQLENRRIRLASLCADSTEKVLQRTELINSYLEMYNAIESWLVKIGDSFLRGHQDPGGSLSLAKDFLHLHITLKNDLMDKNQEIATLSAFLDQLSKELSEEEFDEYREKVEAIKQHCVSLKNVLDSRIKLIEKYVKFHEEAEKINEEFENLERLLKSAKCEADNAPIEEKWAKIQKMYLGLDASGRDFIRTTKECEYPYLDVNRAILCVEYILENLGKRKLVVTDLFTHYQMKVSLNKELSSLWNTYRENLKKMEKEMYNLEDMLCPLLRGDSSDPEGLGSSLEKRLNNYVKALKKVQEDIENMVTKAEGLAHSDFTGGERPDIVRALLQLYQNLQNKATDYQILGTMLVQWCKNIAEVHRSCDKLERQFGSISIDVGGVERQLREHEASKHAVSELLKFAQHEADAIIQKIRTQCPREPSSRDIAKIEEMLERRKEIMEVTWKERQAILEKQLKRSQYQTDLKVIRDQLRDLSEQLSRMKGHYGDSLNAALNMKTAFNQFKLTVETLGRRINNFVSTAEKMLLADEDAREIQLELCDLQNKWSTFHMQVGDSQKSIELSIEFFKLVQEAESWFKEGSQLLINVAGESSHIQSPDEARKLQQKIESFITPGEVDQANRISKISSLAVLLYGDTTPQQVEAVSQQNQYMLDSFNVINKNLETLMNNLKEAEQQRHNQEKEQQELAASLAQAQAEAGNARLAALAAEEARRVAEETVTAMAMHRISSETVEVIVQTDDDLPEPILVEEEVEAVFEEELFYIPPMFLTPLVGAAVSEGVKFTFECRVTGDPVPEVVWLKDGLSIMKNPDYKTSFDGKVCTLTIEETFTEDSALFTCKATNVAGVAESSANLVVKEGVPNEVMSPPSFTKGLVDSLPQEGSAFQLEATVTGHPLPVVSWSKNGICIDNSPDYILTYNNGECVLRFEELFLEDSAEYACKATNDLGEDVTRAKITVLATMTSSQPSFPVPLSNLMARAGQKFKLECEVQGTPTPSLAWFHNNKPVKETPDCKISFDGKRAATLVISEAFPKNAGKYTLVAKNTAGEAQTSSNVSVKGRIPTETSDSEITSDVDAEPVKPSMQQALKDITANEGDSIRLDCIIIGQPEPEVIWYHDEKPVKESEDIQLLFHGDRCSLVIHEALPEDVGVYKVVAMNSAGEASTSCFVNVEAVPEKVPSPIPSPEILMAPPVPAAEPPRFSLLLLDTHVLEGESASLTASVSGYPKPTIAWFRDGVPLLPDNEVQIYEEPDGHAKIYIPHTNLNHTGHYEVVASNSAGTAKCLGFLSVEPRLPSPPIPEPEEPPVFTKLLNDITVQSDDFVTLEASVIGKPKPSVYWTLNESPVNEFEYLHGVKQYTVKELEPGTHSMKIAFVTKGHDGRVALIAENEAGRAVSACRLRVFDPVPPEVPVSEGFERRTVISETHVTKFITSSVVDETPSKHSYTATATTRVNSETGQPTVEVRGNVIQQLDQEGSAPPQRKEKVSLIKLEDDKIVEQISKESSADYVPPTAAKRVLKRKSTPARFIAPLQGIILKENDKAVFECSIDGYPEPSIKWAHNGAQLPEDVVARSDNNRLTLTIPRVNQNHGGRYTCSIDNEAGSAQCTCDLVVRKIQFPPVFSKRLQPSVIGVGERLHLEIDVSGTPTPQVSWSKNGHPLQSNDSLTIKTEGTRSWLVIPEAQELDSGRYGVTASNGAGRAECLADVMVTSLTICEPTKTLVFTDVTDDSRRQAVFVEEGQVKSLKNAIESSSTESEVTLFPISVSKIETNCPEQITISNKFAAPAETAHLSESEVPEEKLGRKPPGKLRLSWPPPPSDDESDISQKLDINITKNKVYNIVSTFTALSEAEPLILKEEKAEFFEKAEAKIWKPSLIPEPVPQYGYIESAPQIQIPVQEEEQDINFDQNVLSSSEFETFDGEFSDNVLSTPATSDYYPKTSPSVDLENTDKFHQIIEQPELAKAVIEEVPVEVPAKPEDMEVKTERHSRESSFTEIKKSVSTSEKTIIETKIYRDYPDGETEVVETREVIPPQTLKEITEFQPLLPHVENDEVQVDEVPKVTMDTQKPYEKSPLMSSSYSSEEKQSSLSTKECRSSYTSSTQVETKVYPKLDTDAQELQPKETSSQFLIYEKATTEDAISGDEHIKHDKQDKMGKKKRESVKQIALRLEESIMPISPDEIPGGIRMFPPKPPTPSVETPQSEITSKDTQIHSDSEIGDKVKISFKDFPKLEPFPFKVDERPVPERQKFSPPPKPKKFIPGSFSDNEYESDFDVPIGERFVPKKIKFDSKERVKSVISSSTEQPPPPSAFDNPPQIEGMRPEVLKEGETVEQKRIQQYLPKKPQKKPKIVQKFLEKASYQTEFETATVNLKPDYIDISKPISRKLEKLWPPAQVPVVSPAIQEIHLLNAMSVEEETKTETSQQFPKHPQMNGTIQITNQKLFYAPEIHSSEEIDIQTSQPFFVAPPPLEIESEIPDLSQSIFVTAPPVCQTVITEKLSTPQNVQEISIHSQTALQGFKSVKTPVVKKQIPATKISKSPAPPFDLVAPSLSKAMKDVSTSSIKSETTKTLYEKKHITAQETKRYMSTKTSGFAEKESKTWPPKTEEPIPASVPWSEARSHSLERPPVTTTPSLPKLPHEAPPAIYWSSNITLKEKRSSLPLELANAAFKSISEQNIYNQNHWNEIQQHSESRMTSSASCKELSKPKHVTIDEASVLPLKKTKSSLLAQRLPTPVPSQVLPEVKATEPSEMIIGFKPIPDLEPFPFEVPQTIIKPRQQVPPPPKPKKFVPGTFTESDYDSDYEGKPASVWRPYMSDTEYPAYKPVKVKLKQGRTRRPKGPSPPPPTQFEIPSQATEPLRPTVSLSDLESIKPSIKEPLPMTPINCKFTKKSLKYKTTPLLKPIPIKPTSQQILESSMAQPKMLASQTISPSAKQKQVKSSHIVSMKPIPKYDASIKSATILASREQKQEKQYMVPHQPIIKSEPNIVSGVRSLRDKFQAQEMTTETKELSTEVSGRSQVRVSSPSSSPSPMRGAVLPHKHVSFSRQDQKVSSYSKVPSSTPKITEAEGKIIPFTHENYSSKTLSPKSRQKIEAVNLFQTPREFEESGYTADTEATLPRKVAKSQTYETAGMESHYSKAESHLSSSSKSQSGTFHSRQTSTGNAFSGIPLERGEFGGVGGGAGGGFPFNGGFPDSFSFPSHPFPTFDQSTNITSSFTSSESKSSQYYSSTKTEEFYEKRSEAGVPDFRKYEEKSENGRRKPKFEEFKKETKGTPSGHGPFSEDTYYSMSDESEVMTDQGKKKNKVEMKTESHVQTMSDKKSEYYSYSSGGDVDKAKKESPKSKKKRPFKPADTFQIQKPKVTSAPKQERKIEITLPESEFKTKPKQEKTYKQAEETESIKLTKQEITRQVKKDDLDLKPFQFKTEPEEKITKQKGTPPTQPKKFVKGEFHESDYGSDFDIKITPIWKKADSDTDELSYNKVEAPKIERKLLRHQRSPTPPSKYDPYPKFDDTPRPVIEFPDSEPEVKETFPKISPKIIKKKPDFPQIIPKQEPLVKAQLPFQPTKHDRSPSPVLQRESTPEEGYIEPPSKRLPYSNAVGVESTKITKIEDSSQYHKRFMTMEQTTRVIKLSEPTKIEQSKKTKPHREVHTFKELTKLKDDIPKFEHREKVQAELPQIQMKPMPKLEPFPFTPDPSKPKKKRGSPPPTPTKFVKGEMRESEYESDQDIQIKPKWHPPDSDVDEPVYGKVSAPKSPRPSKKLKPKERTPTPPSVFDKPPPMGEPMRPTIESIEFIMEREHSPEFILPTEISLIDEKTLAKSLATREPSPPLPPPGTPPEEGVILSSTEYSVDKAFVKTEPAPPPMKESPTTTKKKPFREVIERTEKKIMDKHYTEERTIKTGKVEIIKTTITDLSSEEQDDTEPDRKLVTKSSFEEASKFELLPLHGEKEISKKKKHSSPPHSKKFTKKEVKEISQDGEYVQKIAPLWKPYDSDLEEPSYSKVDVTLQKTKRFSKKDREPTPPSVFDKGPPEIEILRRVSEKSVTKLDERTLKTEEHLEQRPSKPQSKYVKTTERLATTKPCEYPLPEPGPKPEIGFIKPEHMQVAYEDKQEYTTRREGIDIDIDIVDVYDYISETESERVYSDIGSYKSFPELKPFPFTPDPPRPKRERGQPPSMPKKFMKGEFKESDYDSETDGRILPKWGPTDSEGEGLEYRKVKAPSISFSNARHEGTGRVPSPPSKFDQPPSFEGPPRPVVDFQDIPRRERRESLEEYSILKFPKVEFKPFNLDDDITTKVTHVAQTTDTETDTESLLKKAATKKYVETTQKYVGEQFTDMNQNFRDRAQRFAEQLVSEVFATRDEPGIPDHKTEPLVATEEQEKYKKDLDGKPAALDEPQAYRDESRVSEFGSKRIDPDTGLIYFKYDFGYEFGIILPGEGKNVKRSRSVPPGKKNGDIEIPVIHIRSDDEGSYQRKSKTTIPKRDKYDEYRGKTVPKKQSANRFSDSESETRITKMADESMNKAAEDLEGFQAFATGDFPKPQQTFPKEQRGPSYQLSSPSLVSSASATTALKMPAFITPLKDLTAFPGHDLKLECVVQSNITPTVSWYRDGIPLIGHPRCHSLYRNGVCRLILCQLQPEEAGHFTCSAENEFGECCTSSLVTVVSGEVS